MKDRGMTSFERMKEAVRERVKEDLGVEVTAINSHTSCTLKVVAIPEMVNAVEVFVPTQIFVGARTSDVCASWDVDYWKNALKTLCLEFGVRKAPYTRLMTKRVPGASPRMYANLCWIKSADMSGWGITVPEIPKARPVGEELLETVLKLSTGETSGNPEVVHSFEQMGLKFCRK